MTNPTHVTALACRRPSTRLTRREVLKAAAAGLVSLPSLIPARALGKDGRVAPSERILLGGRGRSVLK